MGIAFGVMVLIVILSVMNGFQMGYIDSILEVHSSHIRLEWQPLSRDGKDPYEILASLREMKQVTSAVEFTESQALMEGRYSRQSGALIRGVPEDILDRDPGLKASLSIVSGSFDLSRADSIVIGSELARALALKVGDEAALVAVSGGAESDLFPQNAGVIVTGIVKTGYYEIDSTFAYVSISRGLSLRRVGPTRAAVKIKNRERDASSWRPCGLPFRVSAESWRTFNRSFFGALRVEKNMLFFLVILIFLVVTVNIHNSMRRAVYERREEIGVLSALGSRPSAIRWVFLINGFTIGFVGAVIGLLLGLLISVRINDVFVVAEAVVNGASEFASAFMHSRSADSFSLFSPEYFYLEAVPVRIFLPETVFVFLFGVLSSTIASWMAMSVLVTLKPAEVLRYE
jgi:lipoprotein-releasing system permease protein